MSFTPEHSAIKVTKTLEQQISEASSQAEVQHILREAAVSQGVVKPDLYDPNVLLEVASGTQPRGYARAVTINGTKHVVEGVTEIELEKAVGDLYRAQLTPAATTQQIEQPQPRNQHGQFTTQEEADRANQIELVRRTELDLKFKRGELDTAAYLEQSGAVADYLEKAGVPLADLQATIADKRNQRVEQSWTQSTEEFLHSTVGADWPGGEENLATVGRLLQENNLTDQPSVETLSAVWKFMKQNNLAVENKEVTAHNREVETHTRIANANSPEEIREALGRSSTSLFGR